MNNYNYANRKRYISVGDNYGNNYVENSNNGNSTNTEIPGVDKDIAKYNNDVTCDNINSHNTEPINKNIRRNAYFINKIPVDDKLYSNDVNNIGQYDSTHFYPHMDGSGSDLYGNNLSYKNGTYNNHNRYQNYNCYNNIPANSSNDFNMVNSKYIITDINSSQVQPINNNDFLESKNFNEAFLYNNKLTDINKALEMCKNDERTFKNTVNINKNKRKTNALGNISNNNLLDNTFNNNNNILNNVSNNNILANTSISNSSLDEVTSLPEYNSNNSKTMDNGSIKNINKKRPRNTSTGFINDYVKRNTTFTKRKGGIINKCHEIHSMTGCRVKLIVVNNNGRMWYYESDSDPVILGKSKNSLKKLRICKVPKNNHK